MRLILIGDSLVEYFEWQHRFPQHEVWNLGRSGETVQELLRRVDEVARRLEEPHRLLIMSGINNVAQEDYGFIPAYAEILQRFRQAWPQTQLAVNCLLPVRLPWVAPTVLPRLNDSLEEAATICGAVFLDIYNAFLDDRGLADERCLLPDGVHISDDGYLRWSNQLQLWLETKPVAP